MKTFLELSIERKTTKRKIVNKWAEHSAPQVIVHTEETFVIPLWVTKLISAGVPVKDIQSYRHGQVVYTSVVEVA